MPSSYTTSLRLELQFSGENLNTWGDRLNGVVSRVEDATSGWLTKALTGNYSLTTANGSADEARMAMLRFTGSGAYTVTVPPVSKRYDVWNACTGVLTITNGSGSVTLQPGEKVSVMTDGGVNIARVQPTDFAGAVLTNVGQVSGLATPTTASHATSKAYVDAAISQAAFTQTTFGVPVAPGDSGKFLSNNGSSPSWSTLASEPTIAAHTADLAKLKARRRLFQREF